MHNRYLSINDECEKRYLTEELKNNILIYKMVFGLFNRNPTNSSSNLNTNLPGTSTISIAVYNTIAAFNKANYNYTPQARSEAIKNELMAIANKGDLGSYTLSNAIGNSYNQGLKSASTLYSNTKKTLKNRGGKRRKNRKNRTHRRK